METPKKNNSKPRQPSIPLAIKALGRSIKTLEGSKAILPGEASQLKQMHKTIVQRWIGLELGE